MLDTKTPPKYNDFDLYLWADFVEILCALDPDGQMSPAQYVDWYKLAKEGIIDDDDDEEGDQEEDNAERWMNPSDKYEAKANKIFNFFTFRSSFYAENYPFEYNGYSLKLKNDALKKNNHLLYLYLLCASHLNIFGEQLKLFTGEFEHLSCQAAKLLAPPSAIIHNTGKTALGPKEAYRGNLFSKLKQIAFDLNEKLEVKKEDFAPTNSGDGGIDIIGWVPFGDKIKSRVVFAGQCKCSPDWFTYKRAGENLESFMSLNNAVNDFYFIPHCFRRVGSHWHETYRVKNKIVIDRSRLIKLLIETVDDISKDIKSLEKVSDLLQQKVSIS